MEGDNIVVVLNWKFFIVIVVKEQLLRIALQNLVVPLCVKV